MDKCSYFLFTAILLLKEVKATNNDTTLLARGQHNKDCWWIVEDDHGNITSPGYPDSLPTTFKLCDWVLQGQRGHRIKVNLTIDLPKADFLGRCRWAYLAYGFFDYQSRRVVQRELCGQVLGEVFVSPGHSMWLQLLVTGKAEPATHNSAKGFLMTYTMFQTDLSANQLLVGLVCGFLIPAACCVSMTIYCRKQKHKYSGREADRRVIKLKRKLNKTHNHHKKRHQEKCACFPFTRCRCDHDTKEISNFSPNLQHIYEELPVAKYVHEHNKDRESLLLLGHSTLGENYTGPQNRTFTVPAKSDKNNNKKQLFNEQRETPTQPMMTPCLSADPEPDTKNKKLLFGNQTPRAIATSTPLFKIMLETPQNTPPYTDFKGFRYGSRYRKGSFMTPTLPSISESVDELDNNIDDTMETDVFESHIVQGDNGKQSDCGCSKKGVMCAPCTDKGSSQLNYKTDNNLGQEKEELLREETEEKKCELPMVMKDEKNRPDSCEVSVSSRNSGCHSTPEGLETADGERCPKIPKIGGENNVFFTPPEYVLDRLGKSDTNPQENVSIKTTVADSQSFNTTVIKPKIHDLNWENVKKQRSRNLRHEIAAKQMGMTRAEYDLYRRKMRRRRQKYYNKEKTAGERRALSDIDANTSYSERYKHVEKKCCSLRSLPALNTSSYSCPEQFNETEIREMTCL